MGYKATAAVAIAVGVCVRSAFSSSSPSAPGARLPQSCVVLCSCRLCSFICLLLICLFVRSDAHFPFASQLGF